MTNDMVDIAVEGVTYTLGTQGNSWSNSYGTGYVGGGGTGGPIFIPNEGYNISGDGSTGGLASAGSDGASGVILMYK